MGDPSRVADPTARPILAKTRDAIVDVTGASLVGLYLYGSLASGDFEPHVSDIDLIAVLTDPPDELLASRLRDMHARLPGANPEWDDRVEVDYVSARGLADCLTDTATIARISPGEPLHIIEAGRDFLLDWYPAREEGVALLGPPVDSLIPPIPEAEYLKEVRRYLAGFATDFDADASPGSQAFAILTMCRGLCTVRFGERPSKREAGLRVGREFPQWADLIDRALRWRDRQWEDDQPDGSATAAETRAFISDIQDRLDAP